MNVLIIDFYHSTDNVGGLRWKRFAKYLPEFDINPIILTSGDSDDDDNVFHKDTIFKTKVRDGRLDDSLWGRFKRFVRGNFFIPDPRRLWFAYADAKRLVEQYKIPLIITTGPPHSVHLIGMKLKRKLGVKWIADFRDPWLPYYYKDLYLTRPARWLQSYYANKVWKNCDYQIAVEPGIFSEATIISNGYDPDDFQGEVEPGDEFVYVGSIRSRRELPMIPYKHVYGVSHKEAVLEMRKAGILILACTIDVIPSKVYEYLASGRPIVLFGVKGKAYELLKECGMTNGNRNEEEIKKYDVRELTKEVSRIIYYLWNVDAV
jgi:glycosyltransferase involved in cell wall biosynthesis